MQQKLLVLVRKIANLSKKTFTKDSQMDIFYLALNPTIIGDFLVQF